MLGFFRGRFRFQQRLQRRQLACRRLLHPRHLLCRRLWLQLNRHFFDSFRLFGRPLRFHLRLQGFHFTSQTRHFCLIRRWGSALARFFCQLRLGQIGCCAAFRRAGCFRFVHCRKLHSPKSRRRLGKIQLHVTRRRPVAPLPQHLRHNFFSSLLVCQENQLPNCHGRRKPNHAARLKYQHGLGLFHKQLALFCLIARTRTRSDHWNFQRQRLFLRLGAGLCALLRRHGPHAVQLPRFPCKRERFVSRIRSRPLAASHRAALRSLSCCHFASRLAIVHAYSFASFTTRQPAHFSPSRCIIVWQHSHAWLCTFLPCGSGGTGRRARLRILWGNTRGGSTPLSRTKICSANFAPSKRSAPRGSYPT